MGNHGRVGCPVCCVRRHDDTAGRHSVRWCVPPSSLSLRSKLASISIRHDVPSMCTIYRCSRLRTTRRAPHRCIMHAHEITHICRIAVRRIDVAYDTSNATIPSGYGGVTRGGGWGLSFSAVRGILDECDLPGDALGAVNQLQAGGGTSHPPPLRNPHSLPLPMTRA
jgi:hypothetical protein